VSVVSICKNIALHHIRRRCTLTQVTSLLPSLPPLHPELCHNARTHPVVSALPGNTPYLLRQLHLDLNPCLHLSSSSLHFLLMMVPASNWLFHVPKGITWAISKVGLWTSTESHVYRVK